MPSDTRELQCASAARLAGVCDHAATADHVREALLMIRSATRPRWAAPLLVFCVCAAASVLLWRDRGDAGRLVLELLLSAGLGLALFLLSREVARDRPDRRLRNHEVFDLVTDGLLVARQDGRIAMANEAVRSMHGYAEDPIEVASIQDLFLGGGDDLLRVILEQIELRGRAQVECVGLRRDDTRFEAVLRAVRTSHEGEAALLLSVQDLTERRLATEDRTTLSRKVLLAQEEERTRISRDLHDSLGQIIAALHFEVDWMRNHRSAGRADASDGAARLIDKAGDELRRICRGLRPPLLDDLGLMPSVRELVEEFETHWPVEIDLEIRLDEDRFPVPPDVALSAFRVLQETLTNVVRHADARNVNVTLVREYQWLVLSVYDDGRGFHVDELADAAGYGIEGMRERARLVNGTIEIRSVPDQGTRVVLRVPVPRPPEEDNS